MLKVGLVSVDSNPRDGLGEWWNFYDIINWLNKNLTLWVPIPQNGQTQSNNLLAICRQIVWVRLTILVKLVHKGLKMDFVLYVYKEIRSDTNICSKKTSDTPFDFGK